MNSFGYKGNREAPLQGLVSDAQMFGALNKQMFMNPLVILLIYHTFTYYYPISTYTKRFINESVYCADKQLSITH